MKYVFIIFLAVIGVNLLAQKPFEGKIVYKMISLGSDKESRTVVYFSKNKIRVEHSETNELLKSVYTILNFDSGKAYIIYPKSKTFGSNPLIKNKNVRFEVIDEIAGHRTTTIPPSKNNSLNTLLPAATLYVGDDLYFPTNAVYLGDFFTLLLFQNGQIALGAKVEAFWDSSDEMRTGKYKQTTISFKADSVIPQTVPEKMFAIPNGYKEEHFERRSEQIDSYTYSRADSVAWMSDTSFSQKRTNNKPKKSPIKNKPDAKHSVLRRKEE